MFLHSARENIRFNRSFLSVVFSRSYLIRHEILGSACKFSKETVGTVLDFGCGTKPYSYLFKHCEEYIGLDFVNDPISRKGRDVDVLYDGLSIPFRDCTFDSIVSFEVFEHLPNLEAILEELYRTLKFGGQLFATTPFLFPIHEAPFDFQRLSKWKWKEILEEAGFEEVCILTKPGDFTSIIQLNLMFLLSRLNPSASPIKEFLLFPVISLFNLVGIIGRNFERNSGSFSLSTEIVAKKSQQ